MFEPQVFMINSGYDGCNYVRINQPCIHNGFKTDKPLLSEPRKSIQDVRQELMQADIIVFHRAEEPVYHDLARMLKEAGKKIVMDNDDTFILEGYHPLAQFNPDGTAQDNLKRRNDNINAFMKLSDLVTTTTITLADEYRKQNPNTVILPNCIDPDDWDKPLRNEGKRVRIGLVGSVAMEYDYLHLKDVIKELGDRDDVELCLFGLGDKKHRKNNPKVTEVFKDEYEFWDSIKKEHFPWVKIHLYTQQLNDMRLDMMLIPRKDNYFNRCKSNLKFLEASMCEIPVIAQSFDNGPYEEVTDGVNGILIKDNKDWREQINRLIDDKELRRRIGKNAREYVIKNYDIKDHYMKWADAYNKLI